MNSLRKGSWSGPSNAINEPGSVRFQESSLLAKRVQRYTRDNPPQAINDGQLLNKRSAKMKSASTYLAVLIGVMGFSCSRENDGIVVGGLYASRNEDGTYSVSKVLAVDRVAVHVRIYKNKFPALPQQVDTSVLSLGKLGEPGGFGIGHAPIAREGWLAGHTFLKKEPVRDEELEGYKYYLDATGK